MHSATTKKTLLSGLAALAAGAVIAAGAAAQGTPSGTPAQSGSSVSGQTPSASQTPTTSGAMDAQTAINAWPDANKKAAQSLIDKYGQPDLVSDRMIAWHDKQQFKKVAVFRDSVQDPVVADREDFVESAVSLKVSPAKAADLLRFDPSLIIDLPHGTVASLSDSEKANTIALNLAYDVLKGKRSVAAAKTMLKSTLKTTMAGKSSPLSDSLQFTPEGGSESSSPSSIQQTNPESAPDQSVPSEQTTPKQGY